MGVLPDYPGSINGWYTAVTVPFTGEFSIPLGRDARRNASFELEGILKGFFLELYRRIGISSLGVNYFYGSEDRSYLGLVGVLQRGRYILEGSIAPTGRRKTTGGGGAEFNLLAFTRCLFIVEEGQFRRIVFSER
jgi:hypothetical protein